MPLSDPTGGLNVTVEPWPVLTKLQMRRFLWVLGIPSPSLIHKGKKHRKS